MSLTVYKYQLRDVVTALSMPEGAIIMEVQNQAHVLTLWAMVDRTRPPVVRRFQIIGTGHEVPPTGLYLRTVQMGEFVWHIFELMA